MDRVVTMNRCAQESRGGLNVRHPPLPRGRAGMAHGRHHRPVKQSSQLPSHMPCRPLTASGRKTKSCSVIDLSKRNVWAVLAKMRDTQQSCSCADSMKPNTGAVSTLKTQRGLKLNLTVHASSAKLVLPSAKLFSL